MNELIKLLAEQADAYAKSEYEKWTPTPDFSGVPHIRKIFNEKFAELIIKECRDVVAKTRDQAIERGWNLDEAMSTAMYDIEEHFGVIQ